MEKNTWTDFVQFSLHNLAGLAKNPPVQLTAKVTVIWHFLSTYFIGIFFRPLAERAFPCINIWREFDLFWWSKLGNIVFRNQCWYVLLKKNFSSAKHWGEGSSFPVVPLCLLHVSFPNTPLSHISGNTRSPSRDSG